jgi:hypothetical protein
MIGWPSLKERSIEGAGVGFEEDAIDLGVLIFEREVSVAGRLEAELVISPETQGWPMVDSSVVRILAVSSATEKTRRSGVGCGSGLCRSPIGFGGV